MPPGIRAVAGKRLGMLDQPPQPHKCGGRGRCNCGVNHSSLPDNIPAQKTRRRPLPHQPGSHCRGRTAQHQTGSHKRWPIRTYRPPLVALCRNVPESVAGQPDGTRAKCTESRSKPPRQGSRSWTHAPVAVIYRDEPTVLGCVMAIDADLALTLDEPLLDCEQAAALLNVRPSWVRDATRAGRLPASASGVICASPVRCSRAGRPAIASRRPASVVVLSLARGGRDER